MNAILDQFANFTYDEKYKAFTEKFNYLDDAHAARRVIEKTIKTDLGPAFRFYKWVIHTKNVIRKSFRDGYIAFSGMLRCMDFAVQQTVNFCILTKTSIRGSVVSLLEMVRACVFRISKDSKKTARLRLAAIL